MHWWGVQDIFKDICCVGDKRDGAGGGYGLKESFLRCVCFWWEGWCRRKGPAGKKGYGTRAQDGQLSHVISPLCHVKQETRPLSEAREVWAKAVKQSSWESRKENCWAKYSRIILFTALHDRGINILLRMFALRVSSFRSGFGRLAL